MKQVRVASSVDAGTLWQVVSDVTAWPDLVPTFTSVALVDGRPGERAGDRYRVVQPGLPPAVYEVTQWLRGHSFTWVARSPGLTTTAHHEITETPTGAALELTLAWSGALAPLVRALVGHRAGRLIAGEAAAMVAEAERRVRGA